jgi:hypothetical protein
MPPAARRARPAAPAVPAGSPTAALLAASEDFLAAAQRAQPDGMLEVVADAHAFPEVLGNLAQAMQVRYSKAQMMPFHAVIKDLYQAVHGASVAVQQTAEDIGPLIERIHRDDLDRLRNPRTNEQMWDASANQGAA